MLLFAVFVCLCLCAGDPSAKEKAFSEAFVKEFDTFKGSGGAEFYEAYVRPLYAGAMKRSAIDINRQVSMRLSLSKTGSMAAIGGPVGYDPSASLQLSRGPSETGPQPPLSLSKFLTK